MHYIVLGLNISNWLEKIVETFSHTNENTNKYGSLFLADNEYTIFVISDANMSTRWNSIDHYLAEL